MPNQYTKARELKEKRSAAAKKAAATRAANRLETLGSRPGPEGGRGKLGSAPNSRDIPAGNKSAKVPAPKPAPTPKPTVPKKYK